jgi:hypothetical protein
MNDLQGSPGADGSLPARRNTALPAQLNFPSRGKLFRAALAFEIKLAVDGLKDLVLAPLAIVAVAIDLVSGSGREGKQLRRVLLLGERYEGWLNLYGSRGVESSMLADGGSDVLMDEVERRAVEMSQQLRSKRKQRKKGNPGSGGGSL